MELPPLRPRFRVVRVRQRRRPRALPLREIYARAVEAAVKPVIVFMWIFSAAVLLSWVWFLFITLFGQVID